MLHHQNKVFVTLILIITFFIFLFLYSCKSLPGDPDSAHNPLDPDNPDNSFTGTSLVLSPTIVSISGGSQFTIDLWVVETDSLAGFNAKILFDPDDLQVEDIDFLDTDSESLMLDNGGSLVYFEEIDSTEGHIILDCAVVEGSPRNVIGTGVLSRISFKHQSGTQTEIDIASSTKFRNNNNNPVSLGLLIGSEITVK